MERRKEGRKEARTEGGKEGRNPGRKEGREEGREGGILSDLGKSWGVAINCWAKEGGRGEAINSFSP